MALKGQLQHFSLGEVFQALAAARHTGSLVVQRGDEKKTIYFSTGSITVFSTGRSIRLGEILVREGKVTDEQVMGAAELQEATGKLLGTILVEQGHVTNEDVQAALQKKVEDELYELFLWDNGSFEFLPNYSPPESMDPQTKYTQLNIDPQLLLMEGMRQLDEWELIRQRLPDARALIYRQTAHLPPGAELEDRERKLWDQIPDRAQIAEILRSAPDTRARTMSVLYRFVNEGWMRVLEFDECLEAARQYRKDVRLDEAVATYLFLYEKTERGASDPAFLQECAIFLLDTSEKKSGVEVMERAMELYTKGGDDRAAWGCGMRLYERGAPTLELLRTLWAIRAVGPEKIVDRLRDALIERLLGQGRFLEVEEVMSRWPEEFKAPRFMILRADAMRHLGKPGEAIRILEQAATLCGLEGNLPDQIRCAEQILEIDPARGDARRRLNSLLQIRERQTKRQRRHIVGAVIAVVLVIGCCIGPLNYELDARQLFRRARMVEKAYADRPNFEKVIAAFRKVVDGYPLSSQAGPAHSEVERLERLQAEHQRRIGDSERAHEQSERDRRHKVEEEARQLMAAALKAVMEGDDPLAREHCKRLQAEFSQYKHVEIRFPLRVSTLPQGATVSIDGEPVGTTPWVHRYVPGKDFVMRVECGGFQAQELTFSDHGEVAVLLVLERDTTIRGQLPAAMDGRIVAADDLLFVPCRDGRLYAFKDTFLTDQMVHWHRPVGIEGHPSATVRRLGADLLVSSLSGRVARVRRRDGESVWTLADHAPLTAEPAIDGDGRWLAYGNELGETVLVDAVRGRRSAVDQGEFPVTAVGFDGRTLYVADRARRLRTFSVPDLKPGPVQALPATGIAFLPGAGMLCQDGSLVQGSGVRKLPAPVGRVCVREDSISYGAGEHGWVVIQPGAVRVGESVMFVLGAPLVAEQATLAPGRNHMLHCLHPDGREAWKMATGGHVGDMIQVKDRVFLFMTNGKVILMDGQLP